jgi:hypothetical protein
VGAAKDGQRREVRWKTGRTEVLVLKFLWHDTIPMPSRWSALNFNSEQACRTQPAGRISATWRLQVLTAIESGPTKT